MNLSNPNSSDADRNLDADWRALRYVANEMSVDEALAFEEELGEDQSMRDAVVRAVNGTQLLDAAFRKGSGPRSDAAGLGFEDHAGQTSKVGLASRESQGLKTTSRSDQSLGRPHRRSTRLVASVVALLAVLLAASFLLPGTQSSLEADEDLVAELWGDSIGLSDGFDTEETVFDNDDTDEFELVASSWLLDALDESEDLFESPIILDGSEDDAAETTEIEVECA